MSEPSATTVQQSDFAIGFAVGAGGAVLAAVIGPGWTVPMTFAIGVALGPPLMAILRGETRAQ